MSFEKWLENNNEVISDTCSDTVDELYAEYVYEMRHKDTIHLWSNLQIG